MQYHRHIPNTAGMWVSFDADVCPTCGEVVIRKGTERTGRGVPPGVEWTKPLPSRQFRDDKGVMRCNNCGTDPDNTEETL